MTTRLAWCQIKRWLWESLVKPRKVVNTDQLTGPLISSGHQAILFHYFLFSWWTRHPHDASTSSIQMTNGITYFAHFFFWLCHLACKILVPQPGIEPEPWQWKCWVLTPGPPGNSLESLTLMTSSSVDLHSTDSEISVTMLFSSTVTTLMGMATVFPVRMAVFRISVSCQKNETYVGQGSYLVLLETRGSLPRHVPLLV